MRAKLLILGTFLFCFAFSLQAQTPYYDALRLDKMLDKAGHWTDSKKVKDTLGKVLTKYQGNGQKLNDILNKNPYINTYAENLSSKGAIPLLSDVTGITGVLGAGGVAGQGVNVTSVTDALAKFMIKRAKEELIITFLNSLKDHLKMPEIGILLPTAISLLNTIHPWEYANHISTLTAALNADIKNLLGNVVNLKDMPIVSGAGNGVNNYVSGITGVLNSSTGLLSLSSLKVGDGILKGGNITDVLDSITGTGLLGKKNAIQESDKNTLNMVKTLTGSVRSKEPNAQYISRQDFDAMFADPNKKNLFLGIVLQQLKTNSIQVGRLSPDSLINPENEENLKTYFDNFLSQTGGLAQANDALRVTKTGGLIDMLPGQGGEPSIPLLNTSILAPVTGQIFETAGNVIKTATNISVLHEGLALSSDLTGLVTNSVSNLDIANNLSLQNYSSSLLGIFTLLKGTLTTVTNDGLVSTLLNNVLKDVSFATNLLTAQTSDQLEQAIENVALPVGSATIKKHSRFNVAINTYLGVYGGKQRQATDKDYVPVMGIYAPVGVTLSKPFNPFNRKEPFSISLLVTVFDISPVVSYRLTNSNEAIANDVKIRLNQIFSPGASLVLGFPKVPLSLGGGVNLSPLLTKVESDKIATMESHKRPFRWQIFLAIDIPVINLYNKAGQ